MMKIPPEREDSPLTHTQEKDLVLYNTKTRTKAVFTPLNADNVRMYVCGPTVYDYAHIGNARPVVVFDLLFRLLRQRYGTDKVTYARNITDVDDKIMMRAVEENTSIDELTERTTKAFHKDMDALGALRPTKEPRATQHIGEMITLIQKLIDKGHAYAAEGHALFDVSSMPEYGQLSGRSTDDMIAGARVEVAPYKKNPMDFVLWKPSDDTQVGWDSPWGRGRPGWHIECSAMSWKHLGSEFDIHGGGIDLVFPHHENEIAQSCSAHSDADFKSGYANVWMHNGFLQIEGQKMSKSLGNFLTVHDLLTKDGIKGEIIRLTLLRTQYRQPLDWTARSVAESKSLLDKWYRLYEKHYKGDEAEQFETVTVPDSVLEALYDDLNTPLAFAKLGEVSEVDLIASLKLMGFLNSSPDVWFGRTSGQITIQTDGHGFAEVVISPAWIQEQIDRRNQARKDRNFALADEVRKDLSDKGISLEDTANGTIWRKE